MLIKVTSKDIRKATRISAVNCPIGRALARYGYKNITVGPSSINCCDQNFAEKEYELPSEIQEWLRKFDSGETVRVLQFELES